MNRNIIIRKDLTEYAFGLMQDLDGVLSVARAIAPVVPTGVTNGLFNKFETTAAFKVYTTAERPLGGQSSEIQFSSTTGTYAARPFGLRINIDSHERAQVGDDAGALALLEQAKVRTLLINCALAYTNSVVSLALAGVNAESGLGNWSNANKDPIDELNAAIEAVWSKSGILPNTIVMSFGAWRLLAGNPNVASRMPGADLAVVNSDRVARLLLVPNVEIIVAEAAKLYGGGFGNASASRTGLLGNDVLVCFSSQAPTVYDPSYMKTFAPAEDLFTNVTTYETPPHLSWYELDWSCDPQVVSSLVATKITVS